jgi:hypothetical protein
VNWQAVAAARLAFITSECLPNVDAEGGQPAALPLHPLENKAPQQRQRGVRGHSAAIRDSLPNWHSERRAV